MEEAIKELEKRRENLQVWLEQLKKANEIAPQVQQDIQVTEWEIDALKHAPPEASDILFPSSADDYIRRADLLDQALPYLLVSDYSSASASTSAGSAGTYSFVARVGDLGTPEALLFSNEYTRRYVQMQEEQSRPQVVRSLVQRLGNAQTVERFDKASRAFYATKTGTGERSAAAGAMRTLLDGIQGDLFEKARNRPKENMNWGLMSERLAKGGTEQKELVQQESNRSSIISQLSDVLKDREGGAANDLNHLWVLLLEHIYTVLNLISLDSPAE